MYAQQLLCCLHVHLKACFLWESVGKISELVMFLYMPCLPSMLPFLLLQSSSPVWYASEWCGKIERQRRVTIYFPPTRSFVSSPQPITIHFPKGAGIRDETRSVVLPETLFLLPGSAVKPELWCLSAGVPQFKFQGIHFLKPSFASLREFSSPFNVIESCKCAGIPHFSQRTDFILLEV